MARTQAPTRPVASVVSRAAQLNRPAWSMAAVAPVALPAVLLTVYLVAALTAPGAARGCPVQGLDRLTHWDGAWYLYIAGHDYAPLPGRQQASAFFPLLPGAARLLHLVIPPLSVVASGIAVNLAATCAACALVARTLASWPHRDRTLATLALVAVPGAFVYVAFYSEALFTLGLALVLYGLARPGRLWWAAIGVAIASADRTIGILLLVPLLLTLWRTSDLWRRRGVALVGISLLGLVGIAADVLVTGAENVFAKGRQGWPGAGGLGYLPYAVRHGLGGTASLVGDIVRRRPIPGEIPPIRNSPVWAAGLAADAVLVALVRPLFRLGREIAGVGLVLVVGTIALGPIISQLRFAVVVIPAWIAAVALLRDRAAGRWVLGLGIGAGVVANVMLTRTFATCGWAG